MILISKSFVIIAMGNTTSQGHQYSRKQFTNLETFEQHPLRGWSFCIYFITTNLYIFHIYIIYIYLYISLRPIKILYLRLTFEHVILQQSNYV